MDGRFDGIETRLGRMERLLELILSRLDPGNDPGIVSAATAGGTEPGQQNAHLDTTINHHHPTHPRPRENGPGSVVGFVAQSGDLEPPDVPVLVPTLSRFRPGSRGPSLIDTGVLASREFGTKVNSTGSQQHSTLGHGSSYRALSEGRQPLTPHQRALTAPVMVEQTDGRDILGEGRPETVVHAYSQAGQRQPKRKAADGVTNSEAKRRKELGSSSLGSPRQPSHARSIQRYDKRRSGSRVQKLADDDATGYTTVTDSEADSDGDSDGDGALNVTDPDSEEDGTADVEEAAALAPDHAPEPIVPQADNDNDDMYAGPPVTPLHPPSPVYPSPSPSPENQTRGGIYNVAAGGDLPSRTGPPRAIPPGLQVAGSARRISTPRAKNNQPKQPAFKMETSLEPAQVEERLQGTTVCTLPRNLSSTIRDAKVSRKYLNSVFHCSTQHFYVEVKKWPEGFADHERDFIFPNPSMNPHLPKFPGDTGLVCRLWRHFEHRFMKVIVKRDVNQWHYLGEYRIEEVRSLAASEFAALSQPMQNTWGEYIIKTKGSPCSEIRTSVALRLKYGRELTNKERDDETKSQLADVSVEDIVNSYRSGHHTIYIWKMWCVAYDERFQRNLAKRTLPPGSKNTSDARGRRQDVVKREEEGSEAGPPPQNALNIGDSAGSRRSGRIGNKPLRRYTNDGIVVEAERAVLAKAEESEDT